MSTDDDSDGDEFAIDLSGGWIVPDEETMRRLAQEMRDEAPDSEKAAQKVADAEIHAFLTEEQEKEKAGDPEPEPIESAAPDDDTEPEAEQPKADESWDRDIEAVKREHGLTEQIAADGTRYRMLDAAGTSVGLRQELERFAISRLNPPGNDVLAVPAGLYDELARWIAKERGDRSTAPDGEGGETSTGGTSWQERPLAGVVAGLRDGTLERPKPTLGHIFTVGDSGDTDAPGALFYPGEVNAIAGDSGSGKSWAAMLACCQEVRDGREVVYIDLEDHEVGMGDRLIALGLSDQEVARFHYLQPDARLGLNEWAALEALLSRVSPSLVVIDSVGESLSMEGCNSNDSDDVARWGKLFPGRIARHDTRPCVLLLDHLSKGDVDSGSLFPSGSQRKRAIVTGVQYMQRVKRPFDEHTRGYSLLRCAKDKRGAYRQGLDVASLQVEPQGGGRVALTFVAQADGAGNGGRGSDGEFQPTRVMEKVSRYLERSPGEDDRSQNKIRESVRANKSTVADALAALIEGGYIEVSKRGRTTVHSLVKPYRREAGET